MPPVDPDPTDPADRSPHEEGLSRRSNNPTVSPWLVVGGLLLLGVLVYVGSAVLG